MQINSIGLVKFANVIAGWEGKKIEYYNCSQFFAYHVELLPELLGEQGSIKSFIVKLFCTTCDENITKKFTSDELIALNENDGIYRDECVNCGCERDFNPESDTNYVFLEEKN